MNKAIKIILVDGRELVRYGLRHMLAAEEDMTVVGDCASAEEALNQIVRLRSDIVLMGTQLPGMNVIEATRSLKRGRLNYGGDVIILAESLDYQVEALEAGVASYLLKDITRLELVHAVRQVYRSNHSVKGCDSLAEEIVELVIPPPANAAWLLRFMCQLGEILHEGFASIVGTVGSWDRGTVITIRVQSTTLASFLIELANMPEVAEVGEEPLARGFFSTLPKKFWLLTGLDISPSKRVSVTLQEAGMTGQELVAGLKLAQGATSNSVGMEVTCTV